MLRPNLDRFKMPRRTVASTAVVIVAMLTVVGFSGSWWLSAKSVRDGLATWAEVRRAEGYTVEHDDLSVSGFPFRLVTRIDAIAVAHPDGDWAWRADRLIVEGTPWDLNRLEITLPSRLTVRYRTAPDSERSIDVTLERGKASVQIARGTITVLDVDAAGIALTAPEGLFRIDRLTAASQRIGGSARDVSFALTGVSLPLPYAPPSLGTDVERLAAEMTLNGRIPRGTLVDALASWRAGGGTLDVKSLEVRWAALRVDATGSVTLDGALRPDGQIDSEIAGHGALLEAAANAGALRERDARLATKTLDFLATPQADGTRVLKIAVTARDGTLFLGPLPLLKLQPLATP